MNLKGKCQKKDNTLQELHVVCFKIPKKPISLNVKVMSHGRGGLGL